MFHANGWNIPFGATLIGSNLILPGKDLTPKNIARLLVEERITFSAAVPSIWLSVYEELKSLNVKDLRHLRILCGGSAIPVSLIKLYDQEFGASFIQGWGMTETSPLGCISTARSTTKNLPKEEQYVLKSNQGYPMVGIEMRVVDDNGKILPWDGVSAGELQVRGPYVIKSYYKNVDATSKAITTDGWFRTGDVSCFDKNGVMKIVDRTKDLIKSGGEWISSVDVENAIMGHPKVLEASVIAIPHPKWVGRPLAVVVLKANQTSTPQEILDYLSTKIAKWQLPDDIKFVKEIPKTSVGKFDKKIIRARHAESKL